MKLKRVQSNLLQQNVFIRDSVPAFDARRYAGKYDVPLYYDELEEVSENNGIKHRIVKREYPITPEYVDSQAESCDYKLDPAGAIANAPKRQNLGDITDAQSIQGFSAQELENLRAYLAKDVAKMNDKAPFVASQQAVGAQAAPGPVSNGGSTENV
ncbi:hypothetical protein [Dipodfec virus UOA04_Rod_682]|nr:hypothetical protein [Dipodfec virus UOA04_Rod_682]